jgi:RNAse (barnase) inhibitor barstar
MPRRAIDAMPTVSLDGAKITDWPAFHRESQAAFGFPDFYGRNMSAWIDCLSGLRDADGMSSFTLGPDEMLQIEILHADRLRRQAPAILQTLQDAVADLNQRYADSGEKPALELILR